MEWSHFTNKGNSGYTNKIQLQILQSMNKRLSGGKNSLFYPEVFYKKDTVRELSRYFGEKLLSYSTQSEYVRVLLKALNSVPNVPFEARERLTRFRRKLNEWEESDTISLTSIELIDEDELNLKLTKIRNDPHSAPALRVLAAWFSLQTDKSLRKINLADFINTRMDRDLPNSGFLDIWKGKWKIYRSNSGKSFIIDLSPKFLHWIRSNFANNRYLTPKRDGSKYTQTSTISKALVDQIGFNFTRGGRHPPLTPP